MTLTEKDYSWYLTTGLDLAKKEPIENGEQWFPLTALNKFAFAGAGWKSTRRDAIYSISRWGKKYGLFVEFWNNGKQTTNKNSEAFVVLRNGDAI